MKVLLTGGTGLIGSRLIQRLLDRGDKVVLLTRRPDATRKKWGEQLEVVEGDPSKPGTWEDRLVECDGVVNLVGEGIFNKRWSAEFKEILRKSRIESTRNVATAMAKNPRRADGSPKVLVSGSAIGYYGPHGEEELDESTPPAQDFMGKLCIDWENAASPAVAAGVRVAFLRTGVVLDAQGGALSQMLPPFKMFVGGPVGSGRQYMSWIHHEDLVGIILFVLDHANASGPFNGTAPHPVTNRDFSTALGKVLSRPSFFPTPGFMLSLMLGEVSNVVTKGQRVAPKQALKHGYRFRFTEVEAALADLLKK